MQALGMSVDVIESPDIWNRLFEEHDFGVAQFAWGFDVNDDTWPGIIFASTMI
jgi:hypothetical protein